MAENKRQNLGRGLNALLGDVARDERDTAADGPARGAVRMIPVSAIAPHPGQPRRHFDEAALEELAGELGDRLTIAKINIDENPSTPSKYGVRGIPTLILFKGGAPAATKIGAGPKGEIKAWLEAELD